MHEDVFEDCQLGMRERLQNGNRHPRQNALENPAEEFGKRCLAELIVERLVLNRFPSEGVEGSKYIRKPVRFTGSQC